MSRDDLVRLIGASADWCWETDDQHRFSWLSDQFETATGMRRSELIGRPRFEFLRGVADERRDEAQLRADLEARRPFSSFIYEFASGNAACRWVSISGVPRFGSDGSFLGYIGTSNNLTSALPTIDELVHARRSISRQKELEHALQVATAGESHAERLMAALNVMADAFAYFDADDRLILFNEAFASHYRGLEDVIRVGISFEELIDAGLARDLWDIEPLSAKHWKASMMVSRRTQAQAHSVLKFRDGRYLMRREMRTDDGGRMGICTDITEMKLREMKVEQARSDAEAATRRLQVAIDALDDGFALWDAQDRLVACNLAFRRQFSFLPDLREGRGFGEMFAEVARAGVVAEAVGREDEWVREHLAKRAAELDKEIEFRTHDGRWMRRRDHLSETGDRVGIRVDITDIKKREAELESAKERATNLFEDLRRTIDSMRIGIVILDGDMKAEVVNKAFYDLWKVKPAQVREGSPFRALMDVNRNNGIYDVPAYRWEDYVESRLAEIRAGDVAPREFTRADGCTLIYSVTTLSGGKRLVSYVDVTDLKDRENALEDALEKSRLAEAVINGVKDPIFVKDANLNFVFVNEAFSRLFQTTPRKMIGRRAEDFVPTGAGVGFEATEREVLDTGLPYEVGEDFEVEGIGRSRVVRKNRVSMASGKDYVACFVFDVTELRRRETEAEQARQRLIDLIEFLPAGVIIYDSQDRFVLANRRVHEALPAMSPAMKAGVTLRHAVELAHDAGYFRDTGDPALDAVYGQRDQWIERYLERYQVTQNHYERRNPDGRWFQVFDTRTEDGTYIGVRVDITELKNREAALRESMSENELFRNLIDNVPVAIYAKKKDLKLAYVNDGWTRLTGVPRSEALGRTDVEVFGGDGEAFTDSDRHVLATRQTIEIEETVTGADGATRYQIARKGAMTASDGSLYLIGSTTDVSELKRRENELMEAQRRAVLADRAKSEFLANMSHEIRTPMNGVLGMAELLAKSQLDPKQKTFTDIIVKSGNALLTIINDILDFSKIDAGQLVLDPAPFILAEAVEDVATLVSMRAKEKDIELIVRVQPGLPTGVVGDAGRVRQIITNLMGNAIKFTDSGHVLVDVTGALVPEGVRLQVCVADTGIGIPADKLDLVFEKFSQVDASSTRRHEGTGLGLAITSRLVALMGGRIGVESTEGLGSTFWFELTLPVAETEQRRPAAPIDVTGSRILIIDDNAINRSILSEQMASWSLDSCAAESGMEGIAVLKATAGLGLAVDCVVLDYQMPEMNGAETARLIRATPGIAETPIVMLTSVDQSLAGSRYRDLGIDAQLVKPARSSTLLETIVATIQKGRSGAEAPATRSEEQRETMAADTQPRAAPVRHEPVTARRDDGGVRRVDILIAEDNEVNQLVFTQIIEETDFSFQIVGNGRLAVEAVREMTPGMILMDVSMPEMNGLEATAAIRQLEAETGVHVPIVGVTAHALKGDRERCLDAGMDDYLSKPIKPNALLEKIAAWLGGDGNGLRSAG